MVAETEGTKEGAAVCSADAEEVGVAEEADAAAVVAATPAVLAVEAVEEATEVERQAEGAGVGARPEARLAARGGWVAAAMELGDLGERRSGIWGLAARRP